MSCEVKRNSSILSKFFWLTILERNRSYFSILKSNTTQLLLYEKEIKKLWGKIVGKK